MSFLLSCFWAQCLPQQQNYVGQLLEDILEFKQKKNKVDQIWSPQCQSIRLILKKRYNEENLYQPEVAYNKCFYKLLTIQNSIQW